MGKLSALGGPETTFGLSDFLVKVKAAGAGDVLVTAQSFMNALFSGQLQSQANAGSAGGTMYYINIGGIKLLWFITGTVSVSGGSPGSTAYGVTFPTSFFSAIEASIGSTTGTAVNTTSLYFGPGSAPTAAGWAFSLLQTAGTNGSCQISGLVIGT